MSFSFIDFLILVNGCPVIDASCWSLRVPMLSRQLMRQLPTRCRLGAVNKVFTVSEQATCGTDSPGNALKVEVYALYS